MVSTHIEWAAGKDITEHDRRDILRLVHRLGVVDIGSVHRLRYIPGEEWGVLVESPRSVAGNRITWTSVAVSRADRFGKPSDRDPDWRPIRVGRWSARRIDVRQEERWRVDDGAWHVDIRLGEGVTYEAATRIVLAIRRKALVGRPSDAVAWDPAEVNAASINAIEVAEPVEHGYKVTVPMVEGEGLELYVRFARSEVVLYAVRSWIV